MKRGADQKRVDVSDRVLDVKNGRPTGEVLLDETLRLIKMSPPASIAEWINLLSGETWNVTKLKMQLKQVRERLAKGLVDKGVLRTEKRNFLLFDMPTHPLVDTALKDAALRRVYALLTSTSFTGMVNTLYAEEPSPIAYRVTRALCMVCCAYGGNVIENTLTHLPYETREDALERAAKLLADLAQWPMAPDTPGGGIPPRGTGAASLSSRSSRKADSRTADVVHAMQQEFDAQTNEDMFELVAGVLEVFRRMDTVL